MSSQRPKIKSATKAATAPKTGKQPTRSKPESPQARLGSLTLPWGLADGVGFTVGLSMVAWWPWPTSSTSLMAMTVLTVSIFACLPWIVIRWRSGLRPTGWAWIPVGAAGGLVVWALVSMAFSGAPWPVSVYGWWGRQDGVLTLIGVAILLAAAASLRREEIERLFTWLLLAGTILVLEALAQLAGWEGFRTSEIPGVWAAMGNPNFLAAMCGMLAVIAFARVVDRRYPMWQRAAVGGLLAGLVATSILTLSAQGPVTLVVGASVMLALRLIQWRGPQRVWVALGLGVAGVVAIAITLLGLVGSGPLTRLWASESTGFRKTFWELAANVMGAMPVFGTGPDGLARYAGQYRSEQFVAEQGANNYLDAAHNLPLQYGATVGVLGLVLWVVMFASALVLILVVAWRRQGNPWLVATTGGVLAVYVSQALISIDDIRLKEMGWLAVALTVALARVPATEEAGPTTSSAARWGSPILGVIGLALCLPILMPTWAQSQVSTVEEATSLATNPVLACGKRLELVTSIAQVYDVPRTWAVASAVADLDERCPQMAASFAELAELAGDDQRAKSLEAVARLTDPRAAVAGTTP